MKTMLMTTEQKRIHDSVENAWLGLTAEETQRIINPFDTKNTDDIDNPHIQVLKLLRNPDYFYFTCKHIFNIQILPFQLAILKELWNRKYPMLIASRGAGKCITGDSIVMTDSGFNEIGTLVGYNTEEFAKKSIPDKILNENGTFNNIEYGWNNGFSETIKLTTSQGYSIEGTLNHPIRVYRDNCIVWSELKDIKNSDYILIDRKDGWFEKTNDLNPELAYLFGLLVGDGGYTVRGTISFTSNDNQLHKAVDNLSLKYFGKNFSDVPSSSYARNLYSTEIWDSLFNKYGFGSFKCSEKQFPKVVLSSSKESMAAFIRGLFDTDGTVTKRRKELEYCAKSTKLIRTLQVVLTKFGIISKVKRRYNKLYDRYYNYLYISGNNVNIFQEKIGFGLIRKKELLKEVCLTTSNTNIDIFPFTNHGFSNRKFTSIDKAIELGFAQNKDFFFDKIKKIENGHAQTFDIHCLEQDHSFISNGIVSHNSFILALYAMLRAFLHQGCKIIIVGAAFRQSKVIFEYCENIWNNAPILRSMADNGVRSGPKRDIDRCTCIIGESQIIALPIGDGSKIRGQRANYIIADEFASMSESIYENVISGFAAVRANVVDTVKNFARTKVLKEMNLWTPEHEIENNIKYMGNQAILSGTAYYDFNHFAKYWKRYKQIILSKGDHNKLAEIFGGEVPESFNYRDYCVIRIPVELLPDGFMDEKHVARSKATVHSGIYAMEFSACFSVDSNGFFKRTLIESCVVGENGLIMNSGEKVAFSAKVKGDPNIKYVYGVDPASERDNFSITILEMRGSHRRIVYCWTTTKNSHKEKLKAGVVQEHDFYHYCGRKIRDLMKVFPTDNIIIDSQGGGVAVEEVLQDPKNLLENEKPLWRVIDEEDPKDSDRYEGLHILHFANFASADWVKEANHGLRKDFEDKTLLFPFFDSISLMEAASLDKENNRLYDTLEDCVMEIEELKDELATIVHSQTGIANRDRWDTPEIKLPGGKKGRLRKDRYSALLMANMIARKIEKATPKETTYIHVGGFTNSFKKSNTKNDLYISPSWFKHDFKGVAVKRG